MTDAKGMFEFTIFLGVFYFLYFITIEAKILMAGELTGEGQTAFTELVKIFFEPIELEGSWKFLNLLIFLPIYIFLLFTAIELAEKSVIGSHVVLALLGVLFAGSFIALILPEDFTIGGFATDITEAIKGGFGTIIGAIKTAVSDFFTNIAGSVKTAFSDFASWLWEGIKDKLMFWT